MGVSILPRFAATVSSVISGMRSCFLSDRLSIIIEKGTKVMSATSFVIAIDEKKHSKLRMRHKLRESAANERSFEASSLKIPSLLKPAITAIRQNKRARVRKSM